uniref:Rod shape-determining protein MreD n=1 Tax=Thermodesulfobacterium geofontis TaxID=1295609 RepID=A0A7V4JQR9_9BACT
MGLTINIKELFRIILPLLFLVLLIKSYISSFFLFYPGDIIFAFSLAILTFRNSGILLYILLFFSSLLESLDFLGIEIFLVAYFIFLGIFLKYSRKYFAFERLESKITIWFLSIISFLILRYVIYFYELDIFINWIFILNLALKSFYYIITTFLWVLIFYKILDIFLYKEA